MISLQRSMHSSQMYTPGPAMSFLTCFCDFPQKEHLRRSPPSPNFATPTPAPWPIRPVPLVGGGCPRGHDVAQNPPRGYDLIDNTIGFCLFRGHDEVPI